MRHFFIRLPIVTHEASPWYPYLLALTLTLALALALTLTLTRYPYLLAVYHTLAVPLPFDMRTLGARSKARPVWSTTALRLAEAWGCLRHDLALREAGRSLCSSFST